MVSFQKKLTDGLKKRGFEVTRDLDDQPYASLLVIGGTRQLSKLRWVSQVGVPIIQRLDGMNWLHRLRGPFRSGLRHYLKAEYGNLILSLIRSRIANKIVYQSQFSRSWWERGKGLIHAPYTIIYNGVDLDVYTPFGERRIPEDRWRILLVEGSLLGGYEQGLQTAFQFVEKLAELALKQAEKSFPGMAELMVVGRVADATRDICNSWWRASPHASRLYLNWAGLKPASDIPMTDRSAHLLFSSDINPACPNSVIEALACGLPVIAFDTGALAELVDDHSGRIVPYGGDPWRLDPPDITGLAGSALQVLTDLGSFREGARKRAQTIFGLDRMVDSYLNFMLDA